MLLPLVLVTELGHTLMVDLDIGMKINTLCVVALGVGIGVDYGIYIFARMREAMLQGKTLSESYFIALKTTGIAIFYTALTLAVGVAMWMFSALKFQADMGILLTFMFIVNMIAAIIFLPALCRWLLRPGEKDNWVDRRRCPERRAPWPDRRSGTRRADSHRARGPRDATFIGTARARRIERRVHRGRHRASSDQSAGAATTRRFVTARSAIDQHAAEHHRAADPQARPGTVAPERDAQRDRAAPARAAATA